MMHEIDNPKALIEIDYLASEVLQQTQSPKERTLP